MRLPKLDRSRWIPIALILVASALAYLLNLLQATIYRDDWYYVLDRIIGGAGVFQAMFSIDRPARGPFFELYYQLFGIHPLAYHLASYIWRFLGGLAALWLFRLLWPKQPRATMLMALLFVLFPGYLRWMEGFEDQPRIASVCLQALSFALTLKAIGATRPLPRALAWVASILTGWVYLALVDFATGMEVFRLLCVFIYVTHDSPMESLKIRALRALKAWAIAALIPAGFLFWRLFIFHNERSQTDVGRQLGVFLASPFATGFLWLIRLLQSAADLLVFSWLTPALQQFFSLRPREMLVGGLLALLAAGCVYLALHFLGGLAPDEAQTPGESPADRWQTEAIWIGLIGVVIGVLPVIMANRYVDFQSYSHYALPASLAAAVFMAGLVLSLRPATVGTYAASILALFAVLSHFAYSVGVVNEEKAISGFWHQMAWRAPAIRQQTTLFASYPGFSYGDNADAADGPADLIYFPQQTGQIPVTYQIYALAQIPQTTQDVLLGKDKTSGYRTHIGSIDYDRLLVISQPSASSCVHVIDARWPLFSAADPEQVLLIGGRSHAESILTEGPAPALAASIFGPEPAHRWCYYFEKADLALQAGDWDQVAQLGQQATQAGLHPEDWVEWTPFLQAYAHLGDTQLFAATAHRINGDLFARVQACNTLKRMQSSGDPFSPEIQTQMDNLLCTGE